MSAVAPFSFTPAASVPIDVMLTVDLMDKLLLDAARWAPRPSDSGRCTNLHAYVVLSRDTLVNLFEAARLVCAESASERLDNERLYYRIRDLRRALVEAGVTL